MRRNQPAAVKLDRPLLPDHSKLNREPEESPHAFKLVLVMHQPSAYTPVLLQKIGKHRMRMHRHMPKDVMKNVRLRRVFQRLALAKPGRRWKLPRRQHLKKSIRRQKPAHRRRIPAGTRTKPLVYLSQIGNRILAQPDLMKSVEILIAGMLCKLRHPPAHQLRPHRMLFRRVSIPVLLDEKGFGDVQLRSNWVHAETPLDSKLLSISLQIVECQPRYYRTIKPESLQNQPVPPRSSQIHFVSPPPFPPAQSRGRHPQSPRIQIPPHAHPQPNTARSSHKPARSETRAQCPIRAGTRQVRSS